MIREFFVNENPQFLFRQFGLIHNIFSVIPLIGCLLIYFNRAKVARIKQDKSRKFLKISAWILLLNMFIYTFGNLYFGSFDYRRDLPFHLCFIANYMFMYGILFNKENILKYTIFLSFIGPIPAILWPDLISTIDNFNFWQYVISHHFFIMVSLYSYYALGYKVEFKNYIKTFLLTNALMLIMYPFNLIFDTNYIFSTKIPDNVMVLYPWLKYFPSMLTLEVTGLVISGAVYYFIIRTRNKELALQPVVDTKMKKENNVVKKGNNKVKVINN